MLMAKRKGRFYYRAQFKQDDTGAFVMPGADGRVSGSVPAWHRENVAESSPYCIPNELICATLGAFLKLPIPPFSITYYNNKPYFSSLHFDPTDKDRQPPIKPAICAERFAWLCTGIIFFDILVANEDRHDQNLAADSVGDPKALVVYDHDQALFGGGGNLCGVERLTVLRDRLGVTGRAPTGGNECCLLKAIRTVEFFDEWRYRVQDIPEWFIRETCREAVGIGLTRPEANAAADFLVHRRDYLTTIIKNNATSLPLISGWRPRNDLFGPR